MFEFVLLFLIVWILCFVIVYGVCCWGLLLSLLCMCYLFVFWDGCLMIAWLEVSVLDRIILVKFDVCVDYLFCISIVLCPLIWCACVYADLIRLGLFCVGCLECFLWFWRLVILLWLNVLVGVCNGVVLSFDFVFCGFLAWYLLIVLVDYLRLRCLCLWLCCLFCCLFCYCDLVLFSCVVSG